MTTYYVGSGGNNANSGLSWALRKATLNGAEDVPVTAGDTVYVGPGSYRETLTIDVSGSSGSTITYIADVTGEHTDGVGGIVRITGSDNDQTATRASTITASSKNYRTFTGFALDTTTGQAIALTDCTNWIIQDCSIQQAASDLFRSSGASQAAITIRRCVMLGGTAHGINFTHTSTVDNTGHLVENCIINAVSTNGISTTRVGGIVVKNCTISGAVSAGIRVNAALTAGQTLTTYNSIVYGCGAGLAATVTTEFTEDYNAIFSNSTARSNVTAGANSVAHSPLLALPLLSSGFRLPYVFGTLASYSTLIGKAGTSESSDDIFGQSRPATSSKKSWGAVQFARPARDTGTVRTGSTSVKLADARRVQIFVPITNASTVFSVYARFETDYAGTKPQMVIKQPGQSDTTVTATGSSGSWEQLTTTLTPSATPGFVVVELVSNNTATSGSYATYFDDLTTTGLAAATNFDGAWLADTSLMNAYMQTPPATGLIAGTPFKGPFG